MNKKHLMDQMRIDVAMLLVEAEEIFKSYSLPITGITLVARDPTNDNMFVILTNEDEEGKEYALNLALKPGVGTRKMDGDGEWNGTLNANEQGDADPLD